MTPEERERLENLQLAELRTEMLFGCVLVATSAVLLGACAWGIAVKRDGLAAFFAASGCLILVVSVLVWRSILKPVWKTRREKKEDLVREVLRS